MGKQKKFWGIIIVLAVIFVGLAIFGVFLVRSILFWNNLKETYGPLTDALTERGIDQIYSTADIHDPIDKLTKGEINVITVASPHDLTPVSDGAVFESITIGEPFYIIFDNNTILENTNSLCMHFANEELSISDCALYSYENIDYMQDEDLISDLIELDKKSYDCYFISMYDVSGFDPGIFEKFTGLRPYIFNKDFYDSFDLQYLDIYESYIFKNDTNKKDPTLIYAGIDPLLIRELSGEKDYETFIKEKVDSIVKTHKNTEFQIILPYYYIGHYTSLPATELMSMNDCYKALTDALADCENVSLQFVGEADWIYSNKYLFNEGSDISIKAEDSEKVVANILTKVHVTAPEDIPEKVSALQQLALNYDMAQQTAEDLSNTCVVILGDSVFDLVRDDTSIQDVFANYTGASVLNYSIGGVPAAANITYGYSDMLGGELKDIEKIKKDIEREMAGKNRLIFILEFGINDYTMSNPISNPEDYYDQYTFEGALVKAIDTEILYNWDYADVIIIGPGHVALNDFGRTPFVDGGHTLSEYRNCSAQLAEQRNLHYIDFSTYLGFTEENFTEYCYADKIHYNEQGRYIAGRKLIEYISSEF